jgi:hypothetical protein
MLRVLKDPSKSHGPIQIPSRDPGGWAVRDVAQRPSPEGELLNRMQATYV